MLPSVSRLTRKSVARRISAAGLRAFAAAEAMAGCDAGSGVLDAVGSTVSGGEGGVALCGASVLPCFSWVGSKSCCV